MKRCKWCNLNNPLYITYHDQEWGRLNTEDSYLFEILILESFQAGLSWECILNKREAFRNAFDNFDIDKIIAYDAAKVDMLMKNEKIVRNRRKIEATINNAKIFQDIEKEFGSFHDYLNQYTKGKILYEVNQVSNPLSDVISRDLKRRGMKFVGTKIIYSFLQATGYINSHEKECDLYHEMAED